MNAPPREPASRRAPWLEALAPKPLLAIPWSEGQQRRSPPDLVKGLLPAGITGLIAPPGSGKSFLALDLVAAVARGVPWHGRRTKGGPVLYVAAEAQEGIWKRLEAYRLSWLGDQEAAPPVFVIPQAIDLLQPDGDTQTLAATALRVGARLIVVDTLSRAFGGGDENSSQDMSRLVMNLDRLRAQSGAALLLVHHTGKDTTKGARGSSVLNGAVDAMLEIERLGDGKLRRLIVRKCRDGVDGATFDFQLRQVDVGEDEDGEPVTSCIVEVADRQQAAATAQERMSASQKISLDALRDAVVHAGEVPPANNHIPKDKPCVRFELWRRHAYERGVSPSGRDQAQRKAFDRAASWLAAAGLIGRWREWVWPV